MAGALADTTEIEHKMITFGGGGWRNKGHTITCNTLLYSITDTSEKCKMVIDHRSITIPARIWKDLPVFDNISVFG